MGKKFGEYTELTSLDGTEAFLAKSGSTTKRVLTNTFWKLLNPRSAGEIAAGITPTDYRYPVGNVMRYGAVADGTAGSPTDNLTAFNNAFLAGDATATNGHEIFIPAGVFYLSDTWEIDAPVTITGQGPGSASIGYPPSRLLFPANKTGIAFYSLRNPGYGSAEGSVIRNLALTGTLTASTTGHGIDARCKVFISKVVVTNFAENGIQIIGGDDTNFVYGKGAANGFVIEYCEVVNVNGNGIFVYGPDANAGLVLCCNCKTTGGWGFWDYSWLANTYIANQTNDNELGSVKSDSGSIFVQQYVETAQNYGAELSAGSQVIGSYLAGIDATVPRVYISGDGNGAAARAYVTGGEVVSIQMTNVGSGYTTATAVVDDNVSGSAGQSGGSGTGATLTPNIVGGKITSITVTDGGSGYSNSGYNAQVFRQSFDEGKGHGFNGKVQIRNDITCDHLSTITLGGAQGGVIYLDTVNTGQTIGYLVYDSTTKSYSTTLSSSQTGDNVKRRITTPESASVLTAGRSVGIGPGHTLYVNGVWLGDGANARHLGAPRTAAPTTEAWAQGDFVFNRDPVEAGSGGSKYVILGWSCVAGGTPGTWLPMRCLTGN